MDLKHSRDLPYLYFPELLQLKVLSVTETEMRHSIKTYYKFRNTLIYIIIKEHFNPKLFFSNAVKQYISLFIYK